jgi:ketosteroid isomerase-like protein
MSQENIDLIREAYDNFARRDIASIFSLFDEEIEFYQSELLPWGGHYRGFQGAKYFFENLLHHIDSRVEPREFIEAGDHIVVIARLHGKVRSNANSFDLTAIHIWTLRGSKAVRFEVYIETPTMLRALGKEV